MRLRLLVPALVYVGILFLSSQPADDLSMLPPGLGVVRHVVEYAVLAAALRWALEDVRLATALTIGAVAALGAVDEAYQSTVPGRDPSVLDWLVDVASGTVVAWMFERLR